MLFVSKKSNEKMSMKKMSIIISVLALLVLCESCNHHTMNPISISNITVSDCTSHDYKSADSCFTFILANEVLEITHLVTLNCASSIIAVDAYCNNNIIKINYRTDGNDSANCYCEKKAHYYLHGVTAGSYKIIISVDGLVVYEKKHKIG